ncbi:enoyl-CoA hydratase/isomerase family protein [Actinomadura sp. DC4]|uniref:enoyl-CoA hydratase/isomerase family protein n=1 Tax=Actinomadura sp. DC4 TaxID=3055069 RepID=UPI0025B1CD16|nr:enoyl-CoA hydratase/isomerase family protein [Actinomadura sp. DC4]MDN3358168.1 enoyl-CoA hydratase/isomerase family protein [Actinomadura sp. DC4]
MTKVQVERPQDGVAIVCLNRPERLNALDDEMVQETLPRVIAELDADPAVTVVVFTGAGRAFCAGGDLEECSGFLLPDPAASEENVRMTGAVPVAIRTMRATSIAAVNGPAVGAGFGLALACDFRFAGSGAFFKAPFVEMGLVSDYGVSYFLPRLVGTQNALDIMLTGRRVPAAEAKELGIVWRVTDSPLEDALEYARDLAARPPVTSSAIRRTLYRSLDADLATQVLVEEPHAQGIALHSAEFRRRFAEYRASITG